MEQPRLIQHIGAALDASALEAQVLAEVARKQRAGVYPPELLVEIADDPLRDSVEALQVAAEMSLDPPVRSTRPVLGGLATFVKRLIARTLHWHTRWQMDQVQTLGGSTYVAVHALQERLIELERQVNSLSRGVQPGRDPERRPHDRTA